MALEVISSLGPIPFYVLFCFVLKDLFIYKLAFLRQGEAERTLPHTGPLNDGHRAEAEQGGTQNRSPFYLSYFLLHGILSSPPCTQINEAQDRSVACPKGAGI